MSSPEKLTECLMTIGEVTTLVYDLYNITSGQVKEKGSLPRHHVVNRR
jgi:hypothetical protein